MKRLASLCITAALLAGCGSNPAGAPVRIPSTDTTPSVGEVTSAPEPVPPKAVPEAVTPTEPTKATAPAPAPAPDPVSAPAPDKPPEPPKQEITRVSVPEVGALPAAIRPLLHERSPWAVAQNAAVFFATGKVYEGPFVAPALAQAVPQQGLHKVWVDLLDSHQDGDRFVFQLKITASKADGTLQRSGIETVEVSSLSEPGYVATGYGRAPWPSSQGNSPVKVWLTQGLAPREANLPAPAQEITLNGKPTGAYRVPLAVLESVGALRSVSPGVYVLELAGGHRTAPLETVMIDGLPYVPISQIVQVLEGQMVSDGLERSTYGVQWQPELRQLLLKVDSQHPIS